MTSPYFLIADTLKAAGNPHHDAISGRFTFGPGNRTRDREDARERTERTAARQEQGGRRQPSSGVLILPEHEARQQGQSVNDNLDPKSPEAMQRAAKETGGSRVFNFSQGEGSDLDRNVRMVTNTNAGGTFERGALRVEIFDPDTQRRHVYQRQMSELPALVRQVIQKRYSVIGQHRRNTSHFVKADATKWITLPNGARIPLHGSSGASQNQQGQQQPQAQQSPQAKPARTVESAQNDGEGLTHAERVTIATKIAAKMGLDADKIRVAEKDESDENGTKLGDYDPESGKITLFPASFVSRDELIGTLQHESEHAKLNTVLGEYNRQQSKFQDGESLTSGKIEIFKELKSVFAESGRATYALADGVSKYSTLFWGRYGEKPSTQTYVDAISETLAEVGRLKQIGQGNGIHPQMLSLYNKVNRFAAELG